MDLSGNMNVSDANVFNAKELVEDASTHNFTDEELFKIGQLGLCGERLPMRKSISGVHIIIGLRKVTALSGRKNVVADILGGDDPYETFSENLPPRMAARLLSDDHIFQKLKMVAEDGGVYYRHVSKRFRPILFTLRSIPDLNV